MRARVVRYDVYDKANQGEPTPMNNAGKIRGSGLVCGCLFTLLMISPGRARAQNCFTTGDMDENVRTALLSTAKRYFDMAARGDAASLKQNAIPSLAADFSGIEAAVKDNQPNLNGAQATPGSPFLLQVEGNVSLERAEFLCGVFGKNGQTANSAEFVIPNLSPGNYGVVILNATGSKGQRAVSFVLQQQGSDWKLGGFYVKDPQIAGHDANWFAERARAFKAKSQNHDAWMYYLEARELAVPVPFMYTQLTDKLYDESQELKPTDLPGDGNTVDLAAGGKIYKLTAVFPLPVGQDLDLVAKYQSADVSDTAKAFQDNTLVMKALLAKYPEFRDAFDGVVVRAVEPSGKDFGSMLPIKEIK
ncbi:MAG: hypothetical protein WB952_06865 [Terriglobales bacterium]